MIIIGEKINSSIPSVKKAIENRDEECIRTLALAQEEVEADYIDVNAGAFVDTELDHLRWLMEVVQNAVDTPLVIDSPNPKALKLGLSLNRNGKPIINSISGEKERYDAVLPLVKEYNGRIVVMAMDDAGMPETAEQAFSNAAALINRLVGEGIKIDDIFVDPLIRPIGTDSEYGNIALQTIRRIRQEFSDVHITCGLSNISFGIPARKIMNQTFLVAAMAAGLDSAIMNPLDKGLMAARYACEALLGEDEYCMEYIGRYREGAFDF